MEKIKELWSKLTRTQKIILVSSLASVLLAFLIISVLSLRSSYVPIINKSISDDKVLENITLRLDQENIAYKISSDKKVLVKSEKLKKKAQSILFRENLIPKGTDPWDIFDVQKWTVTDFERDVNYLRATQNQLKQYIESLDDVDSANVIINIPKKSLFTEQRESSSVTVSLVLTPSSDLATNMDKIKGVHEAIKHAVPGIVSEENISILVNGIRVNDFSSQAMMDEIDKKKKLLDIKTREEARYRKEIGNSLAQIFGADRVEISKVDIVMDYGDKTVERKEITPIVLQNKDPNDPTSKREVLPNVVISETKNIANYKGTGVIPEGAAGFEDNVPPVYKDESGVINSYDQNHGVTNYETNSETTKEVGTPQIKKISVAVAISGIYKKKYDAKGRYILENANTIAREYIPVSAEDIAKAENIIKASINYDEVYRGDQVSVEHIQFDRTKEHEAEDQLYFAKKNRNITLLASLIGIALVVLALLFIGIFNRLIERRRIIEEEKLAKERIKQREAELAALEEKGMQVEMSIEDRARIDLQESAITLAREKPEDVAHLIRTWILEE